MLLELLEVGRLAPSIQNMQPWKFHVIANDALRSRIVENACYGNFATGTPTLVVVTCDTSARPENQEVVWNPKELEYSCVGAMEQVLLAAAAAGLGGCWISFYHGPVHEIMALPLTHVVIGGMLIGHADPAEREAGEHVERKLLTDIVRIHD